MNTEEKKPFEVKRFEYFLETCFVTKKEDILEWLKHCIVHTDKKAPTALVFDSPKNKTDEVSLKTLLHLLSMYIYNDETHKTVTYKEIMSTNEYVIVKKVLLIEDDVFTQAQQKNTVKRVVNKIQYLIDNDTILLRRRNAPPRTIQNHTKIIIVSDIFMSIAKKEVIAVEKVLAWQKYTGGV